MSGHLLRLFYYVVVALGIGYLAQLITGYRKQRIFTTFILGLLGVLAGDFAAYRLGLPPDWFIFGISVVWSIAGAVIFILLFRLIRGSW